ncbi:hypothetical protein AHiyo8_04170 [Arthrobacter sp. Hiyo8]|nr:hypothetical protein AHiyo8_04170 [Arthrobacter sp. Hiyo8]
MRRLGTASPVAARLIDVLGLVVTALTACGPERRDCCKNGDDQKDGPAPLFTTPTNTIHQHNAAVKPERTTKVGRVAGRAGISDSRLVLTVAPCAKSQYFALHQSTDQGALRGVHPGIAPSKWLAKKWQVSGTRHEPPHPSPGGFSPDLRR